MKKLSYIIDNNQIFNNTEIIDQFNQIDRDGNLDEEQKNQNILNVLNKIYDNCQLISKQSNLITQQITQEINIMSQFIKEFENQTKKASISMVENILKNLLIPINSNGFNYIQDILLSGKFERFLIIHNHFLEKYQINICEYQNFFDCAGIQNSFLIELSKIQIDTPDKINKYFQIFQLIFNSYKNLSPENKEQFKQLIIFEDKKSANFFDYLNKYHCNKAKIYNITEIIYELVKKNFSEEKRLVKYVACNQINYLKLTIDEILNKEEQNSEGKQITQKQINIIINKFLQKNQSTGTEKKIFALDFIKKIFFSYNINEDQKIEILEKLIKFIDFSEIFKKDNIFLGIEEKIQSNENKLKCLKILFNNLSEEEKISLYYNEFSSKTLIACLHSIEYKTKNAIFYQILIDNLPKIKSKRMEDLIMSIKNHYDLFRHLINNYFQQTIDKESFEINMKKLIHNPNFQINELHQHNQELNFYQSPISVISFLSLKNSNISKDLIQNTLSIIIENNYKTTIKDIEHILFKISNESSKDNNTQNIKNYLFILQQIIPNYIKYDININKQNPIFPLILSSIKLMIITIHQINKNYPDDQDLINCLKKAFTKDFIKNYFNYNTDYKQIFKIIDNKCFYSKKYLYIESINNSDLLELFKIILSHKDNKYYSSQLEQVTKNETSYNNTSYSYKRKNSTEETNCKKNKTTNFSEDFSNWINENSQEYTTLNINENNQEQATLQINSTNATINVAASQPSTSAINSNQIFINAAQQIPALKQIIDKLDPDTILNSQKNSIQKHSTQTLPNSQLSLNQINSNNRDPRMKQ